MAKLKEKKYKTGWIDGSKHPTNTT